MDIASILATKGGPLITVRPEDSVLTAVQTLAEHNICALIVVNYTGDLVGIVTERHIVREVARTQRVLAQTVGEIMTRDVVRAQRDTYRGAVEILP